MNYIIVSEKPNLGEVASLYADAGWIKPVGKKNFEKTINNTSKWFLAKNGTTLVGMARIMTDGLLYACIYDLIVVKKHQKNNIAKMLMNSCLTFCKESGIGMVHLWPAKGLVPYYKEFGFTPLGEEQPVMVLRHG
jgi:predicted GNAT family N-acyltransferase